MVRSKPTKWSIKTEYLAPLSTWPSLLFVVPTLILKTEKPTTDGNVLQHAIRTNDISNDSMDSLYPNNNGLEDIFDVNTSIVPVQRNHDSYFNDFDTDRIPIHKKLVFPYATALGITVGLGCTLLTLNILVWVVLRHKKRKKKRVVIVEDNTQIPPSIHIPPSSSEPTHSPSHQSSSGTLETFCDSRIVCPTECNQCCQEMSEQSCQNISRQSCQDLRHTECRELNQPNFTDSGPQSCPEMEGQICSDMQSRNCPDSRILYQMNGGFGSLPRQIIVPPSSGMMRMHLENQPLLSRNTYVNDHMSNTCTYDVHPPCITPCTSQTCTEFRL